MGQQTSVVEPINKVILITGCSSGIGKEIALTLAQNQQYIVYATMRNVERKTVMEDSPLFSTIKGKLHVLTLDVTSESSITTAVQTIISNEGHIDVLINNAAQCLAGFIETVTDQQLYNIFDVNFFGVVRMFRAVLPYMRKQMYGHIISIGSVSSMLGSTGLGFYAATKSALESLHEGEVAMLKQWNIRLHLLQSGTIRTNDKHMCEKVEIGSRTTYKDISDTPYYDKHLSVKQPEYVEYVKHIGAPVSEVCQLIALMVSSPTQYPPVVQTYGEAEKIAKNHYYHPTGIEHMATEVLQTERYLRS